MSTSFCASVVIPTTTKPVWIIGLSELSGGFSTIGIDRKTESQSKIAQKYKLFVQQPTGLIHQLFDRDPYPVYRMDISDEILAGFSWQLPILLAHALRADGGRLVFKDQPGSAIIWASGEVKADFTVAPVGDIAEKLRNSRPLFAAALAEGRSVFVFVPAENAADIDPDIGEWLEERQVAIHLVAHLDAVFSTLSLPGLTLAASKPPARTPAFSGNPYRGLEAYGREHRPLFFGRGRAREEALKRLYDAIGHYRPFLLIHGQSGIGKSSLVQAGLVGDIEEGSQADGRFRLASVTPSEGGGDPVAVLCLALKILLDDRQPVPEAANGADETLLLLDRLRNQPGVARRLIVIDQLEEIFDPAIAPSAIEAFGVLLDKIVSSRLVWVIATIRSDAQVLLDRSPPLARLGRDERVWRLDPPSHYELSEIIAAPLALAGKSFSDRMIPEQFADLAAQSPDSLPLLQTVLYRFYEQAGSKKQLTAESLDHIGGFKGALRVWAEEVHEAMLAQGIAADDIDRVLVSLVRIEPETGRILSRSIPYRQSKLGDGECDEDKDSKSVPRDEAAILEHLVKGRLASTYGAEDGPRIRLAHEILITHWPHLKILAERLGAAMVTRDDLEQRTKAWLGANRDKSDLLRGPAKLDAAREFVNESLVTFDDEVRQYVYHSLQADKKAKQDKRRFNYAMAGVAALLVVAIFSWTQWRNSETERKSAGAYLEANMARRALVAGRRREAIETTERALNSDLPFLPDFYDILYNSVYRLSKMELELSKDDDSPHGETLRLKNGLLATSTTDMVTIWSPLDGILSTRKVISRPLGSSLTASLDGSTLFVRGDDFDLLRFRSSSSRWDRFTFQSDLRNYIALDEDTLIACNGDEIVRIELGKAEEDTAIALRKPLNQCDAVEASDGRFFVTTRVDIPDGASPIRLYDLNPDSLQIGQEYDTRRVRRDNHIPLLDGLRGGLHNLDGFITLSDGLAAYQQTIYEPGKSAPVLQIENNGQLPSVSADRSRIAWENNQISVFDVKTRNRVEIPCDCRLIGFRDDRTILVNRGSEIVGVSVDTPLKQTLLTKLAKVPSFVVQLPDKAGILAVNTYGPEEVVLRSELETRQLQSFSIPEGQRINDVRFVGSDEIIIEAFQSGDDFYNEATVDSRVEHRYYVGSDGVQLAGAQDTFSGGQDWLDPGRAETHHHPKGKFDSGNLGRLVFRRDETSEEHVLASGAGEVSATTFIPGRDIVVAGFQNGDIMAWQLASDSSPILAVPGHDGSVSGVLANPSGTAFISWDLQNVKVWPLPTLEKLRQAARELGP